MRFSPIVSPIFSLHIPPYTFTLNSFKHVYTRLGGLRHASPIKNSVNIPLRKQPNERQEAMRYDRLKMMTDWTPVPLER